jgi:hypothetical protein
MEGDRFENVGEKAMTELSAQDITVRTHLVSGGESARGAIFVGGLGAFRFEASRDTIMGWTVAFATENEIPRGLHEHLIAAALTSIGVADGLNRQPPPRILSVRLEDLEEESAELTVDVRDVLADVGMAQGFVNVTGKGRFTFQADRNQEGEWSLAFGLDFALPEEVSLRLERVVVSKIEQALS